MTILTIGVAIPLFAQEKLLKATAEENCDRKICLYPSTLRMANIGGNESIDEFVNELNKILIYTYSGSSAAALFTETFKQYEDEGFEEYAKVYGGSQSITILGKENEAYVGFFGDKNQQMAFYIDGEIRWEKIPTIVQTIESNQLINFFDFNLSSDDEDSEDL